MARPVIKFIIKIVVSSALLFYITLAMDFVSIVHEIKQIKISYYFLSLSIVILSTSFLAFKCVLLLQGSSISHSFITLIKINITSRFYALLLPSGIGPEMIRWYKVTKWQKDKTFFLSATIFERSNFIIISLLVCAIFLFMSPSTSKIHYLQNRVLPLFIFMIFISFLITTFLLSNKLHKLGRGFLNIILPNIRTKQRLIKVYNNFFMTNRSFKLLTGITFLSVCWHLFFLIRMYSLFMALDLSLKFFDVAWMTSSIFLLQMLPISFAGIGLREGAYAYVFNLLGHPQEQGVAIGLLFFSQSLIMALIGGLLEIQDLIKNKE